MHRALPLVIFGAGAFTAGSVAFILPDTRKQTVEEGEIFMKENMCKAYTWLVFVKVIVSCYCCLRGQLCDLRLWFGPNGKIIRIHVIYENS